MTDSVVIIPGDGIGQEVVPVAENILETIGGIECISASAGDHVLAAEGTALPTETVEKVTSADATLFGAAGESAADVILPLRDAVGSFANVRPAKAYPGIDAIKPNTDIVFIRENTEGVYAGIESEIVDGVTTLTRVITEEASSQIASYGFKYAEENGMDRITVAHKANVMRTTDGQFLGAVRAVAEEMNVQYDEVLMDALAMHLILRPEDFDVVICPNLAGDMLSDLAAGLVGGLGLLPSANIGHTNALFEPVHGSAPDIAGQGIANPTAVILSTAMLLEHLGRPTVASDIRRAVESALEEGPHTPDLGGSATTEEFEAAILQKL